MEDDILDDGYREMLRDSPLSDYEKREMLLNIQSLAMALVREYLEEGGAPVSEPGD